MTAPPYDLPSSIPPPPPLPPPPPAEPMPASDSLASKAPEVPKPTEYRFQFRGDAKEYFRIWIVNVALTILTLGIYSAWSKVRTQRYFYGNTWIAGTPFEFLAKPLPILKGRIIGFLLFGSYTFAANFFIQYAWIPLLVIFLIAPWIIVRGLKFRARYSSWSAQTFRFTGTTLQGYKYFFAAVFFLIPTLGFGYPAMQRWQKRFLVDHHRFGGKSFKLKATTAEFYIPYLLAMAILMGVMFVAGLAMAFTIPWMMGGGSKAPSESTAMMAIVPMMVVMYAGYFAVWIFVQTRINNLVYSTTDINGHALQSSLRVRDMIKLYFTNTLAIIGTLGLMIPWAMVRMAKYRAEHMKLLVNGNLNDFLAESRGSESATGAEVGDFFDVDIGL